MPSVSEKQHRAMEAAAHGNSTLGIPQSVGKEFVSADAQGGASQSSEQRPALIRAAGILIVDKDGRALFLKRGPGGDNPGEWCFPGGRLEDGESQIDAAIRETEEESGFKAEASKLLPWVRSISNRETTGAVPTPVPGEVGPITAAGGAPLPISGVPSGDAIVAEGRVDFATFLLRGAEQFVPDIDKSGEHVAYAWAPVDQPPEPLHPGCRVALDRFTMDELGIAQSIADGRLVSPQKYQNIWLFAIRVTGTNVSYRDEVKDPETGEIKREAEYVYRRPENYLTAEFLARCNGLPVVIQHPEGNMLDGQEFSSRVVGTIFLPYIKGDEVWAVAKIFNELAAQAMSETQLSTSPGVVFVGGTNVPLTMEDGSKLLVEGKPALLDHLAICPRGVWDKGGDAAGVESIEARKDASMSDEERARKDAEDKSEQARADARKDEDGDKMERLLAGIDSITKACDNVTKRMDAVTARMDAMEAGKPEETAADKKDSRKDAEEDEKREDRKDARKDSEKEEERKDAEDEKKEEEKRADEARKDAVVTGLQAQIEALQNLIPKARTDADNATIASTWTATNPIMIALGDSASQALPGEMPMAYRRRLLAPMQAHSPAWKDIDLAKLDESTLGVAETQIRKDAMAAAKSPSSAGNTGLRMISERTETGHTINTFVGHPASWMNPLAGPQRNYVKRWNLGNRSAN
jgi:8-oxo-dGTP pyrophosphatase MutT (NUDIX family)